ncbi:MAG: T9SS type A sorting domain-containing protein [Bacteroidales bacterium]|nr:T9SS type A sorting domain-containing protein [Bacteroidales bacterium]
MKRLLLVLTMVVVVANMLHAQDTIRYGETNRYMYMPLDTVTINGELWYRFDDSGPGGYPDIYCSGYTNTSTYRLYTPDVPTMVYGVAATARMTPEEWCAHNHYPIPQEYELYAYLIEKEGGNYWMVDSARWSYRYPSRYLEYPEKPAEGPPAVHGAVAPSYEFYFVTPHFEVDSFYVGVKFTYLDCSSGGETQVRWNEGHLHGTFHYELGDELWMLNGNLTVNQQQGLLGGYFPIIVPPDTDAVECAGVRNFRQSGYVEGYPKFNWDRSEGQQRYQVAYGRADENPEGYRVMTATGTTFVLSDNTLDSTALYAARIRARCHHTCPVHDTVVWSEWSDTVQFYAREHAVGIARTADGGRAFTLSPNPAKGRVTVTVGEGVALPCVLTLRDEAGRELLRHRMEERVLNLPTRGLVPGLYLVTVESPQGSTTQRLVVER